MTLSRIVTLSAVLVCLSEAAASAQTPYPSSSPRTSPYLNLLRPGSPPAVNYYNLVRPEIEFRSSIGQLRQQTQANQAAVAGLGAAQGEALTTGVRAGFQNHGVYFQNQNSGGVASGGGFAAPRSGGGIAAAQRGGGGGSATRGGGRGGR